MFMNVGYLDLLCLQLSLQEDCGRSERSRRIGLLSTRTFYGLPFIEPLHNQAWKYNPVESYHP